VAFLNDLKKEFTQ
jgi:hypothetical protein